MNQAELENRLLSSVESLEDLRYCQQEGITSETFVHTDDEGTLDHGEVYDYLDTYSRENKGKLPTEKDLKALHDFESTGAGDLKNYVQQVRWKELARNAMSFLTRNVERLNEDDPTKVIEDFAREFSDLRTGGKRSVVYLDKDAMDRLTQFDEAKELVKTGKMIGIPTGLSTFDSQYLGFRDGELVVVMGGTGIGKSWLLIYMAAIAYAEGKKLLMISPELTADEQGARFDVVFAHHNQLKLSNQDIITGQGKRSEYKGWLESLTKSDRFPVIDRSDTGKPLSFNDIWRYVGDHKPDLLLVDGLHLISGGSNGRGAKGWEILKEGVDSLKALSQHEKIVTIVAHQPDRSASAKGAIVPPGLSQVGYGFSVMEAADRVISMSRDPRSESHRLYRVVKIRRGKAIPDARRLKFNVDVGEIHEVKFVDPGEFETTNEFTN